MAIIKDLASTQTAEFSKPGACEVVVRVLIIDGHTLTIEKYSENKGLFFPEGDEITEVGENLVTINTAGRYHVLCTGGTGSASIEIENA